MGRMGLFGNGRSLPSPNTSTIVPSGRIFAVVEVLLMSFRPPGRDDSDAIAALGICDVQDHAVAHAEQIDALFAVVLTVVNRLDREWIAERPDCLIEGDAVVSPIGGRFRVVPVKGLIHKYTDSP
jgi:hypothetical protein